MTRAKQRVFGGAALAAVYLPHGRSQGAPDELRLAEVAGEGSPERYGLPDRCPASGSHPVAEAFRHRRPHYGRPLAVLPLGGDGVPLGVLVMVEPTEREADAEAGGGFGEEQRALLELYAEHVADRLETELSGERPGPGAPHSPGSVLDVQGVGWIAVDLTSGDVELDSGAMELSGFDPERFDGRLETLMEYTVPEDLPALMAAGRPEATGPRTRRVDFRSRRTTGELRWLRMRIRLLDAPEGPPVRSISVASDASRLRPRSDEVSWLQRLSASLTTAITVQGVSETVVASLRELGADRVVVAALEADRLIVTGYHPRRPTAWPEEWRGSWPDAPTPQLPTLKAAMRARRLVLWGAGDELEPGLARLGSGALAALPLLAERRPVGVCLVGWDAPHAVSTDQWLVLTSACSLIGQALARARALDAQHELAATLQRSLLPRTLPALPGGVAEARYLPATVGLDVGGDWYDVIPLSDRHVAFVIGDVQGHSAAAATIMGQIRTAIRAYAVEGHSPDVVVSHANRLLVGMQTDMFATCCYVAMDMEEGDTWFVRAGHLPPLVREPDGSTREILVEGGPPLGVLAEAEFPMTTLGLAPGSVLALLTDGLVESASLPLEEGLKRVRDALSAADPAHTTSMAGALIGADGRREDDVALLLLRYDGMRVKPHRASWAVWRLPDAVGHARRFTARVLRRWGVDDGADAVLLVVSELVTNALVHTQGEVRLDLTLAGDRLRVAASDSSPRTPVKGASWDWEATGGRGIVLVEAVSEAWGSVPLSGGKQVWAEIRLPTREAAGEG